MTEKAEHKIEAGICPKCSVENLDYGVLEDVDDGIRYPYTCQACDFNGYEYYEVIFAGHTDSSDPSSIFLT